MKIEQFILPITAVIETGNFIAQLSDGGQRRQTAERFVQILRLVCADQSPWTLHDLKWDDRFLELLIGGADTGLPFEQLAMLQVGAGDLCILTERLMFEKRSRVPSRVWTLDQNLSSYGPP